MRLLSRLFLGCLIVWAIYTSISAFLGVQLYFPLRVAEAEPIPYHRWQSVRIAAFLTFAFFILLQMIDAGRKVYPIKFFEVFLILYTPILAFFTYQAGASADEYFVVLFFGIVAGILHIAGQDRVKKYFQKK